MWIPLVVTSAVGLGLYDVAKKQALRDNAVMPVLFWATSAGSVAFAAVMVGVGRTTDMLAVDGIVIGLIAIKTILVAGSWILAYYAMRALPITIMAPIRASAPLWTLLGALVLFGERFTAWQSVGVIAILTGYALFSLAGRREGIAFTRHHGVSLAFGATLLGAASALYDKYLLQTARIPRDQVQFWFCIGLVLTLGAAWAFQRRARLNRTPFRWRWSIPLIGLLLIGADWLYFKALSAPEVPVSLVSLIRRSNVLVSFTLGSILFRDAHLRPKAGGLLAILIGVAILCLAG